jgi:excisionase family DNA binding protein
MSVTMRGQTYYRTAEVCAMVGISRSTLLRWLRRGILKDASHRDRRGWRLFAESDVSRIADESLRIK